MFSFKEDHQAAVKMITEDLCLSALANIASASDLRMLGMQTTPSSLDLDVSQCHWLWGRICCIVTLLGAIVLNHTPQSAALLKLH